MAELVELEPMHPELREIVELADLAQILVQLFLELPIVAFMLEAVVEQAMDAEQAGLLDLVVEAQDVLQAHLIQVVAAVAVQRVDPESSL